MLGLVGVTEMDTSVAPVMVKVVEPNILPDAAVMVVEPVPTDVARPLEPAVLLIVATDAEVELHVTDPVKFCVVLSEKVPVAVYCRVVPRAMLGLVGVTEMDTSVAPVMVKAVVPKIPPDAAVMVVDPVPTDVARPLEPAVLLIVATDAEVELHVTDPVKFCVVLSEKVPVATNCRVVPRAMLGLVGVTEMNTRVCAGALNPPPELPQPASSITISKRSGTLFDFTYRYSLRDQSRRVSTALQVSHLPPFLHDNAVSFNLLGPFAMHAGHPTLSFPVFIRVGTEQLRQVRVHQTVPGDSEYDARWGNIFPHSNCIRLKLLYSVVCMGHRRSAPCGQDGLSISRNRICGLTKRGLG